MRRPGASLHAQLVFNARANLTCAAFGLFAAASAHDAGISLVSLAVAGWFVLQSARDAREAQTISRGL